MPSFRGLTKVALGGQHLKMAGFFNITDLEAAALERQAVVGAVPVIQTRYYLKRPQANVSIYTVLEKETQTVT